MFFAKFVHCHTIQQLSPFTDLSALQHPSCSCHLAHLKYKSQKALLPTSETAQFIHTTLKTTATPQYPAAPTATGSY